MPLSRKRYDPMAINGAGFPLLVNLYSGLLPVSLTSILLARLQFPTILDSVPGQGVARISHLYLTFGVIFTATDATTDASVTVTIERNGSAIQTLGTFTLTSGATATAIGTITIDLRDKNGKGVSLQAGDVLAVRTTTGSAVTQKIVQVSAVGETYGIAA